MGGVELLVLVGILVLLVVGAIVGAAVLERRRPPR